MKIHIRVKPSSKTDEIIEEGDRYTVKVKEPPIEGRANAAVIRLLARHMGVPEARLRITRGARSKNKVVEVL